MHPRISVIIPAFNEEKRIARCLEALKKQTYPQQQFEVIVVDNGSTDNTHKIVQEAGVTVLSYKEGQGVSATRDFGIKHAHAQLLAFMDADSYPAANWLEMIDHMLSDDRLVAVGGVGLPQEGNRGIRMWFGVYDYFLRVNQVCGKVLPWGYNFAVKRTAFDAVGGFNPALRTSEDWDLSLRLQKRFGKKAVLYTSKLKAYTSTRKQDNPQVFFFYLLDGVFNYINLVLLGRRKSTEMITIR